MTYSSKWIYKVSNIELSIVIIISSSSSSSNLPMSSKNENL